MNNEIVVDKIVRVNFRAVKVEMVLSGKRITFVKRNGKVGYSYKEGDIPNPIFNRGIRQAAGILNF